LLMQVRFLTFALALSSHQLRSWTCSGTA
jgi:hypothetical protein